MTQVSINRRIELAAQWLDNGAFPCGHGYTHVGGIHPEIAAERDQHSLMAGAYATDKTGCQGSMMDMMTDAYAAWQVIRDCEYQRLEAAARERRILALSTLIVAEEANQ